MTDSGRKPRYKIVFRPKTKSWYVLDTVSGKRMKSDYQFKYRAEGTANFLNKRTKP